MIRTITTLALSILFASAALAQGSRADYERADGLRRRWQNKTYRARAQPIWIAEGTRFWYRNRLPGGASEFILVDAPSGKRGPAFDHGRLAEVLAKVTGKTCEGSKLPFERITFEGGTLTFSAFRQKWRCALADYTLTNVGAAPSERPDRRGRNERRSRGRRG
ncbi:MAG: S9 family peptidase, partial [Planctomycetes bacterium]|nr:S9 family peptidase [Planctomycetota bacterium]